MNKIISYKKLGIECWECLKTTHINIPNIILYADIACECGNIHVYKNCSPQAEEKSDSHRTIVIDGDVKTEAETMMIGQESKACLDAVGSAKKHASAEDTFFYCGWKKGNCPHTKEIKKG